MFDSMILNLALTKSVQVKTIVKSLLSLDLLFPGLFGVVWLRDQLNLCKRSQRAVSGSTEATDLRSDPLTYSAGWKCDCRNGSS